MYRQTPVPIPSSPGKIVISARGKSSYVYYETGRPYDPEKKYNNAKRVTIGKALGDGSSRMLPNERFFELFPDEPYQEREEKEEPERSASLRIGSYLVFRKMIGELGLKETLSSVFSREDAGLILDFAAYSIVTEGNAAQYYPSYAFEHPLFTEGMHIYSDSKISRWLNGIDASQIVSAVNAWNGRRDKNKACVYVSYDSTNKNCQAGDVEFAEYGKPKTDAGTPIMNYSLAYDTRERLPLFYESYPGSIPDVSQLQLMIDKASGYGYRNLGFILDRGYFSESNLRHLVGKGYAFLIMMKGRKKLVSSIIEENLHTFEKKSLYYIEEYDLSGITVKRKVFESDESTRFVHLYHSSEKEAAELSRLNDDIRKMRKMLEKSIGSSVCLPKEYEKVFTLYYEDVRKEQKDADGKDVCRIEKKLIAYEEKEAETERLRSLCGYFAIVSSQKMSAREAIFLYKSRDVSEKLFRGDKSYLGNRSLRTCSSESTEAKIFVEFFALVIRSRLYAKLHDYRLAQGLRLNYLTVPAAVEELEKILMVLLPDGRYHRAHATTKTQKTILSAFGMADDDIAEGARELADLLREKSNGGRTEDEEDD